MLKAYAFDIDCNLVITDDTILIDVFENGIWIPKEILQKEDAELSAAGAFKEKKTHRYRNDNIEEAMQNFRGEGRFLGALFNALAKPNDLGKGPSWKKSIEAKRYAAPVGDITARGHPIEELREVDKKILTNILTSDEQEDFFYSMRERLGNYKLNEDALIETYLNNNFYAPCSNEKFLTTIGMKLSDSMPQRKNAAFEAFVLHTKKVFENYYGANFMAKRKIRIGFSDDTQKNIEGLHQFIRTDNIGLMRKYPEVLFRMYNTGEPQMPIKFSYKNNKSD